MAALEAEKQRIAPLKDAEVSHQRTHPTVFASCLTHAFGQARADAELAKAKASSRASSAKLAKLVAQHRAAKKADHDARRAILQAHTGKRPTRAVGRSPRPLAHTRARGSPQAGEGQRGGAAAAARGRHQAQGRVREEARGAKVDRGGACHRHACRAACLSAPDSARVQLAAEVKAAQAEQRAANAKANDADDAHREATRAVRARAWRVPLDDTPQD